MTHHPTASKWNFVSAIVFGIMLVSSSSVFAAPITFNFEELALTPIGGTASVTSTVNGLTVTITRQDDANIAVQNLNGGSTTVSDFGTRTVSNFLGSSNAMVSDATLLLSFSAPISGASLSFGDLGGFASDDDDSPVVFTAFSALDGTGATLDSDSVDYPIDLGFTYSTCHYRRARQLERIAEMHGAMIQRASRTGHSQHVTKRAAKKR
jgi:hypothetical protein